MSFGARVLGPCYLAFGVPATLTVGGIGRAITAIDRTAGVAVLDGVQTVDPSAAIRAADLAALGLTKGQLDDATLTLDGTAWRITSVQVQQSPAGASDGEYLLFLQASS